jgi:hypothetical protein
MSHTRGVCIDPHGYDAGKKIKGKKRHILVDTLGLVRLARPHRLAPEAEAAVDRTDSVKLAWRRRSRPARSS